MQVSDLFRQLSFGPLSNLSIGGSGNGEISPTGQGQVIEYANAGLLRLYSRFVLSEKEVIIRMIEGITSYYLLKRFSEFECPETDEDELLDPDQIRVPTTRYIMDLLNPFEEDVIKILGVSDSLGRDLSLNDQNDPWSVFTPQYNMIQVPRVITCQALGVRYQAKHRRLEPGVLTQEIRLPETLHEALIAFIAWKVFSAMNGQDNAAKANEHKSNYENICGEVTDRDLVNASVSTTNSLFSQRGFV